MRVSSGAYTCSWLPLSPDAPRPSPSRSWPSSSGPPARFVADTFVRGGDGGQWIGLGHTDEGFWSAEAHSPNDACDTCERLDLVVTTFGGKRRSFPVIT